MNPTVHETTTCSANIAVGCGTTHEHFWPRWYNLPMLVYPAWSRIRSEGPGPFYTIDSVACRTWLCWTGTISKYSHHQLVFRFPAWPI